MGDSFTGTVPEDAETLDIVLGFSELYAAVQHEHTEFHHETGEAKYLEKAINDNQDRILGHLAESVRDALGGD